MNSFKGWMELLNLKRNNQMKQYDMLKEIILNDKYKDKHTKLQTCHYCKEEEILLFTCSCNKVKKKNYKYIYTTPPSPPYYYF